MPEVLPLDLFPAVLYFALLGLLLPPAMQRPLYPRLRIFILFDFTLIDADLIRDGVAYNQARLCCYGVREANC
jgi:hypothetical protein